MTVTRPDLIEAAAAAIVAARDEYPEDARCEATFAVDAVLPLIADLLEARKKFWGFPGDLALADASAAVRGLTTGAGRG